MPRYVVLAHDCPVPHWDFLLEAGPVLRAWRLSEPPAAGATVRAEANSDHRPLYLDYEGPLAGDRGAVARWDAGVFEWVEAGPERVVVDLSGGALAGRAAWDGIVGAWTFIAAPV